MSVLGDSIRTPSRSDSHTDVIVVGGGLAGLACALGLRGSGQKVMLVEETSSLGGRARSWVDRKSGDAIDIGPHVLSSEDSNLRSMLDQLGTQHRVVWHASEQSVAADHGRGIDPHVPSLTPLSQLRGLAEGRRLTLRERISSGLLLWLAMRIGEDDVASLDALSAADLLRRYRVAPRLIDWFWAPLSISLLNAPLERCSAGALMRVYAQLAGHRDGCFGFANCALADLYVPAALRAIMSSGGRVHLRTRVVALIYRDGKVGGVVLDDGTHITASHCVLAVTPQALMRLLPARCNALQTFSDTRAFEPSPHVSTYLWLDRKLSGEKVLACPWSPCKLNTGFYDLSNIRAGWRERPSIIAANAIYSHDAEAMSDEEIITLTLHELAEVVPAAAQANVIHSVVNRVPMGIACPAPGTEQKRPPTRTSVDGLLLAGDWTRTHLPSCMESAVCSGWLAAEKIWSAIGRPRRLALPAKPPEGLAGVVHRVACGTRRRSARWWRLRPHEESGPSVGRRSRAAVSIPRAS